MHACIEWDVEGTLLGFMMNNDDINIGEIIWM